MIPQSSPDQIKAYEPINKWEEGEDDHCPAKELPVSTIPDRGREQ
jgi:hypothetical protein